VTAVKSAVTPIAYAAPAFWFTNLPRLLSMILSGDRIESRLGKP
jgi:hypothetical protein